MVILISFHGIRQLQNCNLLNADICTKRVIIKFHSLGEYSTIKETKILEIVHKILRIFFLRQGCFNRCYDFCVDLFKKFRKQ